MKSRWKTIAPLWLIAVLLTAAGFTGCAENDQASGRPDPQHDEDRPSPDKSTDPDDDATDIDEAMAALADGDRAAALTQAVCPVSDEPLGSMGTPLKVTVQDRVVWICCGSCREPLESDPEPYLAKLDE